MPHRDPEARKAYLAENYRKNRDARRKQQRQYYQQNREAILERTSENRDPQKRSEQWYMSQYGLSKAEAEALKSRGCEICGDDRNMAVDHDHSTGAVRGPLCQRCNQAIGLLDDDSYRLRAAADYLDFHKQHHKEHN